MTDRSSLEFDSPKNSLLIHFDVEEHHIKLDTFIQTADSARRIIASLDQTLFGGGLEYEILVLPPEDGTFLQKLALCISVVAGTIIFFDSDTPAGFIEGLTGMPLSGWAKELGELGRETAGGALEVPTDAGVEPTSVEPPSEEQICRTGERLLAAMTRSILELEYEQLKRLGIEDGPLFEVLDARADFYAACFNDGDVNGIGFSADDTFPIPRSSFLIRAQPPARKDDEEDPPEWSVSIESINVTSPNWVEEDQRVRQWKGKDASRRDCYFVIEDAEFWRLVKRKGLHVEVWDSLKVQWAFRLIDGKAKQRRVLRVLEFNGKKLASPLSPDAINAILGSHTPTAGALAQPTLFD